MTITEPTKPQTKPELRPTVFAGTAPHPDAAPCPSWCWTQHGQPGEPAYHEISVRDHTEVVHNSDSIYVRASLYGGEHTDGEATFATLEPYLESRDSEPAQIKIARRQYLYPGPQQNYEHELLRLTLDDARELAAVLNHLISRAEAS